MLAADGNAYFNNLRARGAVMGGAYTTYSWPVAGATGFYLGPEGLLVATPGKDRFEPGSMFRSKGSQERTRSMFDDFCGSVGVLRKLREALH